MEFERWRKSRMFWLGGTNVSDLETFRTELRRARTDFMIGTTSMILRIYLTELNNMLENCQDKDQIIKLKKGIKFLTASICALEAIPATGKKEEAP